MKKSVVRPPSGGPEKLVTKLSIPAQPLDRNKDNIQLRKNSREDKGLLTRNLSKSHDNLASILRKKAAAATLAGNKENVKDRVASPASFKAPVKPATPIRKATSSHSIDESGTPIKRAQSAQSIPKATAASAKDKTTPKPSVVKRASSTQNVNKGNLRQRISAPANAMSHNAELLAQFEKERRNFEGKISELIQSSESRKADLEKNKFALNRLGEENKELKTENRLFRDKLQDLGVTVEHLTDTDKIQLIHRLNRDDSHSHRGGATGVDAHAGSTRASSVHRDGSEGDVLSQNHGQAGSDRALSLGDASSYFTPDHPAYLSFDNWETKSNKSCDSTSEISVACLQDRISQMEETHYCTNEELEATRMELADLQHSVNELAQENEQLSEDKCVLLESLCAQTEKLENCRMQIEHLKTLLVTDADHFGHMGWSEKEKQLVDLIKSAQLEKDELLLREKELNNQIVYSENNVREQQDVIQALRDTTHIQEMKLESLAGDKRALESQLGELKEQSAKEQIELVRYRTLLENEKQKVTELEQERNATDKSDLEDLLNNTRMEKERLEEKLANVQEELAVSSNAIGKLQDTISGLEQDMKVCKNNAKTELSDLEYRLEQQDSEKTELIQEMETLREHVDQLQADCDRYLEEKRCHMAERATLETQLKMLKSKENELDQKIKQEQEKFTQEKEDWQQFQMDLQLAVKVASDFKSEAQDDMERTIAERHFYHRTTHELMEENTSLKEELDKYKSLHQRSENDLLKRNELRGKMISTMDRELAALRTGQKLIETRNSNPGSKESASVKNLIMAIEKTVKVDRSTPPVSPSITMSQSSSRRDSTDSMTSISSSTKSADTCTPPKTLDRRASGQGDSPFKSSLRRSTPEARSPLGHRHTISNIIIEKDEKKPVSPSAGKSTSEADGGKKLKGILSDKRKTSLSDAETKADTSLYISSSAQGLKTDPLAILAKQYGGSKRNALLKWCQHKLSTYPGIDITNFSSSWNDGLAFCALIHVYRAPKIPYGELNAVDQLRNFTLAFNAAKSEGIPTYLNISDMVSMERPDWQAVMAYVTSIYKHFELDQKL